MIPVVALVVVGIGTGAWAANRSPAPSSNSVTYRQVTVATGTIQQAVSTSGTIQPTDTANLSFAAAGQVTSVKVAVGSKVAKGQVLATMDSATLTSQVASAKATVASDQARLTADQSSGASSPQIASDQANLAAAEAQLASAEAGLAGASLVSPIDGTVSAVNLTAGQQIASSGSGSSNNSNGGNGASGGSGASGSGSGDSGSGSAGSTSSTSGASTSASSAQVQVISTGSYLVNATVDSTQVGQVAVGDQAVVTPQGATKNVFGTVASVGLIASTSSGVTTFPVVVDITGSPTGLYAGSTAQVSVIYRQLTDVLVVPTLAITQSGGQSYVQIQSGSSRTQRQVTIGASSGGQTQVVSGVKAGDVVVVAVRTFNGNGAGTGTGRGTRTGGFGGTGGGFGGAGGIGSAGGFGGGAGN